MSVTDTPGIVTDGGVTTAAFAAETKIPDAMKSHTAFLPYPCILHLYFFIWPASC